MARKPKAVLAYPQEYYLPEMLRQRILTPEQMKSEYTRLRNIANKRLLRMQDTRFESYQSFRQNVGKFVPYSSIRNERELIYRLSEVQRFITAKTSTISGIRDIERRTLQTLHEGGYTFITAKNLGEWGEFMAELRNQNLDKLYDSDEGYKLFVQVKKRGLALDIIKNDFQYWLENRSDLEKLPVYRNAEKRSAEYYIAEIESRK